MDERKVRIGDVVDDYCPRCKLIMNHGVIVMADSQILKVRCNTCMNEHPYRHGKGPKKKDPVKQAYEELLGKLPGIPRPPTPPKNGNEDED